MQLKSWCQGHTNKPLILAAPFCRWLPSWLRPLPPSTPSCTLWAMRTTEEASGSSSPGKRSKCLKLRTSPNKWSIQLLPSVTALVVFSQVFRLVLDVWVFMCVLSVQWYFINTAEWPTDEWSTNKCGLSYVAADQCTEVRNSWKRSILGCL